LSGDGGDEFFAGYPIVGDLQRFQFLDRVPRPLRKLVSRAADGLPYFAYGKGFLHMVGSQSPLERYFNLNFMPYYIRKRLLSPEWMVLSDVDTLERLLPDNFAADGADIVSQAMYFEATTMLTGDFLVKVDRASMAASLEVRCPLLDHHLAEFATRIPTRWKWQSGRGKQILLKAMGDRLPSQLLTRNKMGFGVPLDQWFRGPLRELVHDSLLSRSFLERGMVSPEFVRYLLDEHARGRRSNHQQMYRLLMLELWFKTLEQPTSYPAESLVC
jgi:asparagine synthase (glutamine-hydrolysing)